MTTYLEKSCSFGLPRVPFVNCCQFMYLVISLLVLRAGCGTWLYQFLIIAYLFTFHLLPIRPKIVTEKIIRTNDCESSMRKRYISMINSYQSQSYKYNEDNAFISIIKRQIYVDLLEPKIFLFICKNKEGHLPDHQKVPLRSQLASIECKKPIDCSKTTSDSRV